MPTALEAEVLDVIEAAADLVAAVQAKVDSGAFCKLPGEATAAYQALLFSLQLLALAPLTHAPLPVKTRCTLSRALSA